VDLNTTAGAVGWENAPDHYKGTGGIENFDVWDAYEMDPYTANAFKYLARWDKKGSPLNDLMKALHYIEETIIRWERGGWLHWRPAHRVPKHLLPEAVIEAFGLSGQVAEAVTYLLHWRTSYMPDGDLKSAQRYVERAIKEVEARG
jgi:hypothetical protein